MKLPTEFAIALLWFLRSKEIHLSTGKNNLHKYEDEEAKVNHDKQMEAEHIHVGQWMD